ncbi:MAG: 2-oxoglutarate dehydrogenase complex dihydrolipoyllysine-residue succinyltransferase [Spirochaetaceae bacterium]|nr:2-oxoglutarate dehydrogenase complex dihydrolipoyllysine-residue succinyltransferase [Spirochaetaceae bacterium]
MKVDVTVPGVGESITEGLLAAWSVADESTVIEGQAIFELETDKTTIDVTAPATGTLKITVPEGTDVVIQQVVGVIDTEAAPKKEEKSDKPTKSDKAVTPSIDRITPAAKAAAKSSGIDPSALIGSGRDGMVTKEDAMAAKAPPKAPEPTSPVPSPQSRKSGTVSEAEETRKPLSRIRKVIAANLSKTRDELVLLTTFNETDMSSLKSMRSRYGETFLEKHGVKLGFMSFFLKASAAALETYPEINAFIDGDEVVYRSGIHISVAVSTPKGLVTPVVRNVGNLGFADIEKQILEFGAKAKDKTLMPEDLMGGTFTVTNGGVFGSMMSTPLPAPKQSAILGMHAIIDRPVAIAGEVRIRPMMYLALSYDHRLVDGREAVGCLKAIKDSVENPERLMLEL